MKKQRLGTAGLGLIVSLIKLITGLGGTNYQKSNYVLINKVPQKSISAPFTLTINKALVERKKAVKYLGLYIDENLSWSSHIKDLSLQLARSSGIFYRLSKLVSIDTLRTILRALVYSRLQYGIIV